MKANKKIKRPAIYVERRPPVPTVGAVWPEFVKQYSARQQQRDLPGLVWAFLTGDQQAKRIAKRAIEEGL
jgi:hypothetical protein